MAIAFVDPISAARKSRRDQLAADMKSPDPVTRYRAKEKAMNHAFMEISAAMVQQAKANAKAAEQQELEAQRFEREYYKYR